MTYEEIKKLAGHRQVPAWAIKLVGEAIAAEREACAKIIEESYLTTKPGEGIPEDWLLVLADVIRARGQE